VSPAIAVVLALAGAAQAQVAPPQVAPPQVAPPQPAAPAAEPPADVQWRDVGELEIEGRAWSERAQPYDRLPAKAEQLVRPEVWKLAQDSAGMVARFVTDAPLIRARWKLRREQLALPHMPATGVSGLDLYVRRPDGWRWLAVGRPTKQENEVLLARDLGSERREYMLYLPLYNGIASLELGVPPTATLEKAPARTARPIVFYGTSIVQGGCASRPGMAYPAIVGRKLGRPVVNLGFSGNGRAEPELAQLLAELDPAVFVVDPLPNLMAAQVTERLEPFVRTLRQAHPHTPIVLVENVPYNDGYLVEPRRKRYTESNAALASIYQRLRKAGDRRLYYLPAKALFGSDGEDTVDGTHPTDLGFVRMSEAFTRVLRPLAR
jgi:lysophospholipase L1-like esterase